MIDIPAPLEKALLRAAEAAYPEECCGALLGRVAGDERRVSELLPLDNARATQRRRRFLITPDDYRHAERKADACGLKLIGFYHSHPDHPSRPSEYDRRHALPWHSYVIVALDGGSAHEWRSWVLSPDRSRFDAEATPQEQV